jgi:hypothetical protein
MIGRGFPCSRVLKLRDWVQSQPEAYASEEVMSLTTSSIAGPSLTRFEVAHSWFRTVLVLNEMVLVLVLVAVSSSTSTSTANAEYEYEKPREIAK